MLDHLLCISEQYKNQPITNISAYLQRILVQPIYKKEFYYDSTMLCFQLHNEAQAFTADTNYFVGVDWLIQGQAAVYVEPKLNQSEQVDFLGMLLQSLEAPENIDHLDSLFHVDFDSPWINIPEEKDRLSPILIMQFLKLVQRIVKKGLKQSYYRVTENLDSRIKGKILVGQQIKKNVVRNRLTKTICNFQEFGCNTKENQFLKLVLKFVSSYLNQKNKFFDTVQIRHLHNLVSFCMPSFEMVEVLSLTHSKIQVKRNAFYQEYEEAVKLGNYILRRFSYNINIASQTQASTPPFWINMSKLFELYVFSKLVKTFPEPGAVTYHDRFLGKKETDILLRENGYKCVIDCKYKPRYENENPTLDDKRQLAGYTRMKSVYTKLKIPTNEVVTGLIIYSNQDCNRDIEKSELFKNDIAEYIEFFKLGVSLPVLNTIQ